MQSELVQGLCPFCKRKLDWEESMTDNRFLAPVLVMVCHHCEVMFEGDEIDEDGKVVINPVKFAEGYDVIYVKRRYKSWYVWMDNASNENPHPPSDGTVFKYDNKQDALKKGFEWKELGGMEYGVCLL